MTSNITSDKRLPRGIWPLYPTISVISDIATDTPDRKQTGGSKMTDGK
jgi:hypothetical protein